MNLGQRNHIFAFKALTGPDTLLVVLPQPQLTEVFDQGNEDVLRIVFLEGKMGVHRLDRLELLLSG